MPRKWMTLAAVTAVTLAAAGLTMAADEDSPLHKLMEQVNAKSNAIKKATKNEVSYKKAQKDLSKHADDLLGLAKKAGEMKEAAEKQKKPFAEWQKLNNDFIAKTTEFKELVSNPSTKQAEAKKSFGAVGATCAACHQVFRVEDE